MQLGHNSDIIKINDFYWCGLIAKGVTKVMVLYYQVLHFWSGGLVRSRHSRQTSVAVRAELDSIPWGASMAVVVLPLLMIMVDEVRTEIAIVSKSGSDEARVRHAMQQLGAFLHPWVCGFDWVPAEMKLVCLSSTSPAKLS